MESGLLTSWICLAGFQLAACAHSPQTNSAGTLGSPECGPHRKPTEGASRNVVMPFVLPKSDDVRPCFEWALRQDRSVRGCVVVSFTIDEAGALVESKPVWNSTGSNGLGACVAGVIKTIGKIDGAQATTYFAPFVMNVGP